MYLQGRTFVFCAYGLVTLTLIACDRRKEKQSQVDAAEIVKYSKQLVSEKTYQDVLHKTNDSIQKWIDNSLTAYLYEKGNNWRIDSVLCFNKRKDKCIMALLNRDRYPTAKNDGINYLYGVKIDESWYFFKGPFVVLFRVNYQEDIHTPLSFTKLHEIAMDTIFKGYLKKNKKGEWEINDDFFGTMENKNNPSVTTGYGSCFECKNFEEYVLYRVNKNWKNREKSN